MLFNSIDFWMFLPAVLVIYWVIPPSARAFRNGFLLLASYAFYAYWDIRFLGLILLSTSVDYTAGWFMAREQDARRRKAALITSIVVNLSILGYFKYSNFFLDSLISLLQSAGIEVGIATLDIVLPIGISFYTFQSMSYTIDVFRRKTEATTDPLVFALYVAFFPQLMAGPIERSSKLIPQLEVAKAWDSGRFASGFRLFLLGMVKKVVVSNKLLAYAELQYMNPELRSLEEAWAMAALRFFILLMDFSGYSDMAIGIARMLGVELSENFRGVFKAKNFREFWQRWHITLGRWFKDYVMVPMNRSRLPKGAVILVSFTLIGLWHGASWNFVVWGLLIGILWWAERRSSWIEPIAKLLPGTFLQERFQTVVFYALFLWICQLFPTENIHDAWTLMRAMIGMESPQSLGAFQPFTAAMWCAILLGGSIEWAQLRWTPWRTAGTPRLKAAMAIVQSLVLIPMAMLLCFEALWVSNEFEYFLF